MKKKTKKSSKKKVGLWDNIHKKQERIKQGSGEHMRKKGAKGAPSAKSFRKAQAGSTTKSK